MYRVHKNNYIICNNPSYTVLVDVNECLGDKDSCDSNAFCVNTMGSYKCVNCKPGYLDVSGDGKICEGMLIHNNPIIILLPTWFAVLNSYASNKQHAVVLCKTGQNQSGTGFNQLKRQDKNVLNTNFN